MTNNFEKKTPFIRERGPDRSENQVRDMICHFCRPRDFEGGSHLAWWFEASSSASFRFCPVHPRRRELSKTGGRERVPSFTPTQHARGFRIDQGRLFARSASRTEFLDAGTSLQNPLCFKNKDCVRADHAIAGRHNFMMLLCGLPLRYADRRSWAGCRSARSDTARVHHRSFSS